MTKHATQKFKYIENEISLEQIKQFFLEGENPTLSKVVFYHLMKFDISF